MYNQTSKTQDGVMYQKLINTYTTDTATYPNTGFPRLANTEIHLYQDGSELITRASFTYDPSYGNLTGKHQEGDLSATGDERYDGIVYYPANTDNWLVARPNIVYTRQAPGASDDAGDLSRTTLDYYGSRPHLLWKKHFRLKDKPAGQNDPYITFNYDNYGNLNKEKDANLNPMTVTLYDATNTFPETITNPAGHQATFTYDYRYSKVLTKTDANLNVTSNSYDVFGRPEVVVWPVGSPSALTTSYSYVTGAVGQQNVAVTATDSATGVSHAKSTYFDGFGREISTRSNGPEGKTIKTNTRYFNNNGKVKEKSLPFFDEETEYVTKYFYDYRGRILSTEYPDSTTTTMDYGLRTTTFWDRKNQKRNVEERDAYGRLITVTEFSGPTTSFSTGYEYDTLGNLTKVTDAYGKETIITYDTLSRKTAMQDPDMGGNLGTPRLWIYEYDANGNLKYQTDAKLQKIEFQYDAINRLIHKIYIGKDQQIDYSYDDAARPNSKGMLTRVVDLSGTTDFWYDESGRAVTTVKTISGVTGSFTIERDYDAFGRMASLTYPDSAHEVVQYGYDQAGNLSSAGIYAAFSDYNALGQPGRVDYGNGVDTLLQYYDGTIPGAVSYRLESIRTVKSGSNREWIQYAYDNNGNLTDITDNLDPLRSGHYIYNYRDMLGKAQVQDPDGNPVEILMSYGRTGNIESNSRVGSYTYYHSRPHAVRAAGANTYNYDYNGNMTTRVSGARTQSLLFDFENRLSSITEGVNRNEYLYDYTGARVKKQTLVSGAVTSTTVYIGGIYEQKNGENIKHIFAGSRRVASRKGSSTFYFHPDHLGSLSLVTNAAGASYQAETYYPFGGARNPDPADPAEFEYKFTGQENDPESGLYYYGARYYDPEIGRFISPDSIVQAPADPQTLNRYSYCRNNPLMYTDPTGHFWQIIVGALIGAIMSGIHSDWDPGAMFFGAIVGGISGGVFMGAESAVSGALTGVVENSVAAGAISGGAGGMAAGIVSGGLNALYYKGDLGEGIWKGAAFGAASGAAFGALKGLSAGPASNANGLSDNSAANASVPDKMPIPADVRRDLAGFFSDPTPEGGIDYSNVTLQKGVPFFPRLFGATAYTSGNNIYWDPKTYLYPSIPFTAMVGHELIHVGQYANYSVFQLRYFFANIM